MYIAVPRLSVDRMLRWSIQRANGQYRDHLVGQLTTPHAALQKFALHSNGCNTALYLVTRKMTVKLITSQGRCDVASQGNTLLQLMECQVRLHFVASKDCGGCWWRWWLMPGSSDGSQLVTGWCWWSVDRHQFSRHRILFTSEASERTFRRFQWINLKYIEK